MPMWQAEAMWICFGGRDYPFAVKVAAGKINAASGEGWREGLHRGPQDYLVAPEQPWLDGFCVTKGTIRQFVAAPLGKGITAEEQLTGAAEHGGLQIVVHPMKREAYERLFPPVPPLRQTYDDGFAELRMPCAAAPMGLAAGGKMRQEIYADHYDFDVWDLRVSSRCFVTLLDARSWTHLTGEAPPTAPISAGVYHARGVPWFDYYAADQKALDGSSRLAGLKSIVDAAKFGLGGKAWANDPIEETPPVPLGPGRPKRQSTQVREAEL
jgi:hypothetical protein